MPMSPLNRRTFLERTALAGIGVTLAGSVGTLFRPAVAGAAPGAAIGYGPLVADPAGILALPKGFSYTIVSRSGETLLDGGVPFPSDPDANGVFTAIDVNLLSWDFAVELRTLVAILYMVAGVMMFIGLGLVYNLDKKTLTVMTDELAARHAVK